MEMLLLLPPLTFQGHRLLLREFEATSSPESAENTSLHKINYIKIFIIDAAQNFLSIFGIKSKTNYLSCDWSRGGSRSFSLSIARESVTVVGLTVKFPCSMKQK